jgi:hypothetical protein
LTAIFIIGNCHVYGMQRSFQFFDSALFVDSCHVWELKTRFGDAEAVLEHLRRFDHVLTFSFEDEFLPGVTSASIAGQLPQAMLYPTVTFGAFHPDVVYMNKADGSGDFLPSPLGPFHSALALYGYRKGYEPRATIALFRADIYERLGYLSTWNIAIEELARRPEGKDFELPRMALKWLRQGCFMHNPLHPKVAPVSDIARAAMERLGITPQHASAGPYLPDDLLASHVWPVYPEIGAYYGLPGSYTFKRETGVARWPEFMTLEEFVLASYECYGWHDMASFTCERVDNWLQSGQALR